MRAIFALVQADSCDPLINKPGILPSAQVTKIINAAWENIIIDRTTSAFKPFGQTASGFSHDFKLHRSGRLLLYNGRTSTNASTAEKVTDLELDQVTTSQFAVDGEVEECSIA